MRNGDWREAATATGCVVMARVSVKSHVSGNSGR